MDSQKEFLEEKLYILSGSLKDLGSLHSRHRQGFRDSDAFFLLVSDSLVVEKVNPVVEASTRSPKTGNVVKAAHYFKASDANSKTLATDAL